MFGIKTIIEKIFGTANERKVKATLPLIARINALEPEFEALDDAGLIAKTEELKQRVADGESLDAILPEAFANCREGARRALGLRAFDVQLMGGIFLHQGNISEMKTGEGKTLVATFPAYLNALTGRGVHIVTVNDYLAKRDADWMGKVYRALGMETGVIYPNQNDLDKKRAYAADVTYTTNNELGFDYLRDNMKSQLDQMCQRGHHFAIVDEVDSILIDEARTPLIISGPADDRGELYAAANKVIPELQDEHYVLDEKIKSVVFSDEGSEFLEELLRERELLGPEQSLYDPESTTLVHHLNQALRAHTLFFKDRDYIVSDDEVVLIDVFTGRMMPGRRMSEGLHQAIEEKEGCTVQPENVTLAQVTFQNYFRLYDKLSGMTGTALTEAEEFHVIYGLGVVDVPTNQPVARVDEDDAVYRTSTDKLAAVLEAIREAHERGQPTLVGTTSIDKSEHLSGMLEEAGIPHNVLNARQHEREAQIVADAGKVSAVTIATNMAGRGTDIKLGGNVDFRIMQAIAADPDADPTEIRSRIEADHEADEQAVKDAGGLFVLATERHESRRIDNQLRGRSGRQGDPGRSQFFLCLEDDLMRLFGSQRLDKVLSTLGMKEGEAIVHPWVNKSLERAQAKVEGQNFDVRKQLLQYDDVMNEQRKVIFEQRLNVMKADDLSETVEEMRDGVVEEIASRHMPPDSYPDQWDVEGLDASVKELLSLELPIGEWVEEEGVDDADIADRIGDAADKMMAAKATEIGPDTMRMIEKQVLLQAIDARWLEHLLGLEQLRSVVGFRSYAGRQPLNEYKSEAFQMFEALLDGLRQEVTQRLSVLRPMTEEERQEMQRAQLAEQAELARQAEQEQLAGQTEQGQQTGQAEQASEPEPAAPPAEPQPTAPAAPADSPRPDAAAPAAAPESARVAAPGFDEFDPTTWGNPRRNQPCPCGSGRKFKHCHGRLA